ncbi:pilus assembly protein TadG-related protein [Phycicoccus avicenniae]|uniref:pilus assembly protein TadG-related protein n=1 Tax=Phycicoccus avicenniae TaxID=2828860 RepID=UPI003D2E8350
MRRPHLPRRRSQRRDERGYVAVASGLLLIVLLGFSAFAVDVGHWYLEGQRAQRAADAAALAGVTKLPDDRTAAYNEARKYATANDFTSGANTIVAPSLAGGSTRLRVDISSTVPNILGGLLGTPTTTVSRHAIAEFAGPVPLGSPCNRFGDDPDPGSNISSNCSAAGNFFAMVGSEAVDKVQGDAFQNDACSSSTSDGCTSGNNNDYDDDGYIYTVTLRQAVNNLTIEAFDPAEVVTGATCTSTTTNKLAAAAALPASKTVVSNPSVRYQVGAGDWCTGDSSFSGSGLAKVKFTVRSPGTNPWEPAAWPEMSGTCAPKTFQPYNGDLSTVLDKTTAAYTSRPDVAQNFRQWVNLCTKPGTTPAGTYAVQVQTNGLGNGSQGGHNRFSLRAYGSSGGDKDNIAVAGFSKMALFANTPSSITTFYLARIPTNSSGQFFNVNLFDIGDGAASGTSYVRVVPPTETGGNFSGCVGKGRVNGALTNCRVPVSSTFDGRWQTITVPIPSTYSCTDSSPTGCWVRLEFNYGTGSNPTDTTSWSATLDGDPIRLVE